jgi:hypothetical protein
VSETKQPWTTGWRLSDTPSSFAWVVENERGDDVALAPLNSGLTHDEESAIGELIVAAPALAEALARFVTDGEGCPACGMDGRPGCGCKQEQGRVALDACGWSWS